MHPIVGLFCQIVDLVTFDRSRERINVRLGKTHPVVGFGHELLEEAVKGEVQVRPQLLQQLGHL